MEKYIVEVHSDRTVWKNEKGEVHRLNGPAIEYADGDKYWYLNGECHREDGPAIEYANGSKEWYLNGNYHREDGPAIEDANGDKLWYLNDEQLSEDEFNNRNKKDPCEGKLIEIEGEEV